MKLRVILLLLMTGWDASLHLADLFGFVSSYPLLYPYFPLFGVISYTLFWSMYWTFAFLITFTLLFERRKKIE